VFGLIFFTGLAFMAACLTAAGLLIFFACRAIGIRSVISGGLSIAVVLGILLGIDAGGIQSTREFNALCQSKSSRRVMKIVQDVDAVRLRGDVQVFFEMQMGFEYGYVEWEDPPLKWRSNYRSKDICEFSQGCNVEAFTARYELEIVSDEVARQVHRLKLRIVDPVTKTVLATDEGFTLEVPQGLSIRSLGDIFFAPWQLPRKMLITPIRDCAIADPKGFVQSVLVPRQS
jgi:hypothetical protein